MFRRLFAVTAAVVCLASVERAQADLLLEPYLGYEFDNLKSTASGGGDTKYTMSGTAIGARLGYAMPLFWFAADYSMGNLTTVSSDAPAGGTAEKPNATRSSLYAVVGVKVPLIQAYAGYGILNDHTLKLSAGDTTFKGSALKFGAGFTGLPFVALNIEYALSTFNKSKDSSAETDIGASGNPYKEATANSIMLSISAPFRL